MGGIGRIGVGRDRLFTRGCGTSAPSRGTTDPRAQETGGATGGSSGRSGSPETGFSSGGTDPPAVSVGSAGLSGPEGSVEGWPAPVPLPGARVPGAAVAEDAGELAGGEPLELPLLGAGPVQHGDLEVGRGDGAGLRRSLALAEGLHGEPDRRLEVGAGGEVLLEVRRGGLGRPAHHGVVVLVGDLAVVGEPVDRVVGGGVPHLGHEQLDLVGLLAAAGEDRAEGLGVGVREAAAGDVAAVVGVAAHVGQPDAGDPEVLELVVAADGGERDPVVDLADLVQRLGEVLRDEDDAVGVLHDDQGPPAGDALAGEVRPVLHQLLGRDVERHAHAGPWAW